MESEEEWSGVECGTEWVEWRDEFSVWSLLTVTGVVVVLLVVASDVWAAIWLAGFGLVDCSYSYSYSYYSTKTPFSSHRPGTILLYRTIPYNTVRSRSSTPSYNTTIPQYHGCIGPLIPSSSNT